MAISVKRDLIRDIAMMVRKENITFEPKDRVKLDLTARMKDGSLVSYYVGNVLYNQDSGDICYKLYTGSGLLVPSDKPRVLDGQLTNGELQAISDRVAEYVERSIYRARNIAAIENFVKEGSNVELNPYGEEGKAPLLPVLMDIHKDGRLEEYIVRNVFRPDVDYVGAPVYVRGGNPVTGEEFNYPLSDLTDMGVASVLSAMEQKLGKKLSLEVDRKQSSRKQVEKNAKMSM